MRPGVCSYAAIGLAQPCAVEVGMSRDVATWLIASMLQNSGPIAGIDRVCTRSRPKDLAWWHITIMKSTDVPFGTQLPHACSSHETAAQGIDQCHDSSSTQ